MKEKELRFELGKIQRADIGFGGYDDAMFGISFTLEGKAWGVSDFWGTWGFQPSETAKWKEYRIRTYGETMNKILALCEKAKVTNGNRTEKGGGNKCLSVRLYSVAVIEFWNGFHESRADYSFGNK